jgi:hypothetical protein
MSQGYSPSRDGPNLINSALGFPDETKVRSFPVQQVPGSVRLARDLCRHLFCLLFTNPCPAA